MGRARVMGCLGIGLAVITLLLAGCGAASPSAGRGSATSAVRPTATPSLAWRQATWPSDFDPQHWGLAESPVVGRDAWLCAPGQGGGFTVWASRDAAVTWAQVGSIVGATPEPGSCTLVADRGSASSLAAVITWGSGEAGTLRSVSLISADGGADWSALPGEIGIGELASVGGTTYAMLTDTSAPPAQQPGLVESADGLRTWRTITPPGLSANDAVFQFWLGPSAGDLAVASLQNTLWLSDDAGASWSRLPTPDMQTGLGAWLPRTGHWLFCGWQGTPPAAALTCSADQGKSWQQRPTFQYTLQCASCGKNGAPYSDTQTCIPSDIAADASLLADCPTTGTPPGWAGATAFTLYRLAPSATAWTALGAAPAPWPTLTASGQLWCWDPQGGRLFVATLSL